MTTWRLGPYRALDHVFTVEGVECAAARARLKHALAPLALPADAAAGGAYRITPAMTSTFPRHRVEYRDRLIATCGGSADAAGLVLWHVNQRAVTEDRGRHLILHAAGVERDGVLVVLLGESGVGKTTTTAALLEAGFRYVTDEAVVTGPRYVRNHCLPQGTGTERRCRAAVHQPRPPRAWEAYRPCSARDVVGSRIARGVRGVASQPDRGTQQGR